MVEQSNRIIHLTQVSSQSTSNETGFLTYRDTVSNGTVIWC